MRTISKEELKVILDKHRKYLNGDDGGEHANLRNADLRYANLSYADLRNADLSYANLSYANLRNADLRYANLRSADLSYANLRNADLSYANLSYANLSSANLGSADLQNIKDDFMDRLALAKNEVLGLYDYLMRGKVDGNSYKGECCCFVGTVAKVCNQHYEELTSGLKPNSSSPTERWFLAINKGDTPDNNQVSAITVEWIKEFANANEIILPTYKIVSSNEAPSLF